MPDLKGTSKAMYYEFNLIHNAILTWCRPKGRHDARQDSRPMKLALYSFCEAAEGVLPPLGYPQTSIYANANNSSSNKIRTNI